MSALSSRPIGRFPKGTLTNLTDNGSGPNSEQVKIWHASRSDEERWATARKTQETIALKYTKEQRSQRARNNALARGIEALSIRGVKIQAARSSEERVATAIKAGLASSAATSIEDKRLRGLKGIAAYMAKTTKEERQANAKRTGIAKLTKKQLSENGRKGVTIANANRTPEERSALGRKARAAQLLQIKNC